MNLQAASSLAYRSDLATHQDGFDVAHRLRLVQAVLSDDLGCEVVIVLERANSSSENLPHFARISFRMSALDLLNRGTFDEAAFSIHSVHKKSPPNNH